MACFCSLFWVLFYCMCCLFDLLVCVVVVVRFVCSLLYVLSCCVCFGCAVVVVVVLFVFMFLCVLVMMVLP